MPVVLHLSLGGVSNDSELRPVIVGLFFAERIDRMAEEAVEKAQATRAQAS